jgi:multidrug efflux pump subunit AcrA (membrane-fusion protein)
LILGIIMALVCLVSWVTAPVVNFIRYLAAGPQLRRVRARAVAITAGLAAAALVLLAVVPFPRHFRAPGVAQARQRTEVVNDVAGVVEQILAESGARVSRGQPLMRLSNRKLELELAGARARYAEAQARLLRALTQTNADLQPLASRLDSVSNQLAKLTADQAALTIVARHDGIWVAPRIKDSIGRRIERGMSQGLLIDPAAFEFVATVQQADADSALASQPRNGEVRLRGQAGVVLKVSRWIVTPGGQELLPSPALGQAAGGDIPVSRKDPGKATEPFFEIRADLAPCADAALLHGRRGAIRFELKPEPLLPRWLRSLRQLLQKRYKL